MFHVPEPSRLLHSDPRVGGSWGSDTSYGNNGAFILPTIARDDWQMLVIASDQDDWEHVSVHLFRERLKFRQQRIPTWLDMMIVKRIFWDPEDAVMQIAPPESQYVNCHPHTLHWWRPLKATIPLPPMDMVGPRR